MPSIIAITEVKPKNSRFLVNHAELHIQDYEMFSANLDCNTGRGVAIYVHTSLQASQIDDVPPGEESLWLEIKLAHTDKLLVGCCYRSPGSTQANDEDFHRILEAMCARRFSHVLVCGDFNHPEIDWIAHTTPRDTTRAASFLETIDNTYMYQHIKDFTRSRGTAQRSTLDLVLTNEEQMLTDLCYEAPLGRSDHCVLRFTLVCYSEPLESGNGRKFLYHKGDYDEMRSALDIDWEAAFADCPRDPNRQYNILTTRILEAQQKHIPSFDPARASKYKYPVNKTIREAIHKKHRAWQRFMETRCDNKLQDYHRQRNKVRKLTRQAKLEYERRLAREAKQNPKKFWRYAKSHLKVKEGIPDLKTEQRGTDGSFQMATSNEDKAETLSSFFSNVFTDEPDGEVPVPGASNIRSPFQDEAVPLETVRKLLKELDPNKAMGPDNMHPRVLRELSDILAKPLTHIFETSIETGLVPSSWREANISAIHKKGDKKLPGNYRPVSLTSVVCKIMEKVIRTWILDHMTSNHLISNQQYGFLPKRSTTTQLLTAVDQWLEIIDSGGEVDVIYFDFAKAFDTVPHKRLLQKIKHFGISPRVTKWLTSFLTQRRQRVTVRGTHSDWRGVTSGIPQGSVLGPILFVLYINDLPEAVRSDILLFADDTKVYREISSQEDRQALQDDVTAMERWSADWLLKFHPAKCKTMTLSSRGLAQPEAAYTLGGKRIKQITQEKDIGVIVDNKLSFDQHIASVANKGNRIMWAIRRCYTHLEEVSFRHLFRGLVRPHLEYAQPVWKPYKRGQIHKLEQVQRRATKLVPTLRDRPYPERLQRLLLPTLAFRRLRGDMIETFKITHGLYDPRTTRGLLYAESHTRTRGHPYKLKTQQSKKTARLNSFSRRIVSHWNSLPWSVVTATTVAKFEQRLDSAWRDHPLRWDPDAQESHRSGRRGLN